AKISCMLADAGQPGADRDAATFLSQAGSHLDEAETHLVLVGGLPGTGKTTLARGLADRFGWAILRSDEVRKELAGLSSLDPAGAAPFEGIYTPEVTAGVYGGLLHRAELALASGESVVLDATWLDPEQREAARATARAGHATLHELCCDLALEEAGSRIRARAAAGGDASDATPAVLARLATEAGGPWAGATRIDTSRPPTEVIDHASRVVRPARSDG
ncbi:MAG TPA: AAA family ATPase, partial [Motilibacterales bacterium]|nr:AAA family ATPase [Motilibacterales bacterium]